MRLFPKLFVVHVLSVIKFARLLCLSISLMAVIEEISFFCDVPLSLSEVGNASWLWLLVRLEF